jgi:hypothetical protein
MLPGLSPVREPPACFRRPLFEPVEEVADMNRRWFAVVVVCVGTLLAPATSAAGGGAVFEFDSDYFVPGDYVEGKAVIGLSTADEGVTGGLEDGPFSAYLIRSQVAQNQSHDPEDGINLAQIHFAPMSHGQVEATINFVVPDVKPGLYVIETCNAGCSVQWIGDLVGGWFTVVATREEIPLRELEDRLTERIRTLQGRLALFRDRLVEAETEANGAASDAQLAVNAGRDLESDVKALKVDLARLREDSDSSRLPQLAEWFAAGLLAGVGIALLIVRRRRRPELIMPPEDASSAVEVDDRWRPEDEPELVVSGRR